MTSAGLLRLALLIALMLIASLGRSAAASIELRGGGSVQAPIVEVSLRGVEVGGDAPRLISWDRVRRITGEHADEAEAFRELSDQAWRARTRLARGDIALAQPLFEDLFDRLSGGDGPTTLVVAEGLLACRIATGAHASAIPVWLEALRLRRQGWSIAGASDAAGVIDPQSGLAPALPPIWLDSPATAALATAQPSVTDDPVVDALWELYRIAASQAMGSISVREIPPSNHPGVTLVSHIVASFSDNPEVRAEARRSLRAGIRRDSGDWREAWRRVAMGKSLLMESDEQDRRRGMIHLLHAPARFSRDHPHLAGVALALVIDALRVDGRGEHAATLLGDLESLSPAHPALQWLNDRWSGRSDATEPPSEAHKETL